MPIQQYDDVIIEQQVPHSTSLHTHVKGRPTCHVGPLARYSLNFEKPTPQTKAMAKEVGLGEQCFNPFKSIQVRGIEVLHSFEESLQIIANYEKPDAPHVKVEPRASTGYGCTEAPRGICYYRYTLDEKGIIQGAKTFHLEQLINRGSKTIFGNSLPLTFIFLMINCSGIANKLFVFMTSVFPADAIFSSSR